VVQRRVVAAVSALLVAVVALLGATTASAQETVTIPVGDFYFCAPSFEAGVCETTISAGDTVVWDFSASQSQHTTTECGASCDTPASAPLWNSGFLDSGTFSYTFAEPGTYLYFCRVHPVLQRGTIVVQASPVQPTEPPIPNGIPTTSSPQTSTPAAGLPRTGGGPNAEGGPLPLVALVVAGAISLGAGAFVYARGRRIE
jgi:plastocyanin